MRSEQIICIRLAFLTKQIPSYQLNCILQWYLVYWMMTSKKVLDNNWFFRANTLIDMEFLKNSQNLLHDQREYIGKDVSFALRVRSVRAWFRRLDEGIRQRLWWGLPRHVKWWCQMFQQILATAVPPGLRQTRVYP